MADDYTPDDSNLSDADAAQFLAMDRANVATQIRNNIPFAIGAKPDQEATFNRLAKLSRLPISSVRAFPDDVKAQVASQNMDVDQLAMNYPRTADLLADLNKARMLHDDVQPTSAVEHSVHALTPPGWDGASMTEWKPSAGERAAEWLRNLFGVPAMQRAQAQNTIAERAAGIAPGEARNAMGGMSELLTQFVAKGAHAASFDLIPDTAGDASTLGGQIGGGLGALAGFMFGGPVKASEYLLGKAAPSVLEHVAGESFMKALARDVARQSVNLGIATGLQSMGDAMDSPTIGRAASTVGTSALHGAETGAVFGSVGRMLPDSNIAQFIARTVANTAGTDATQGKTPFQDIADWGNLTDEQKVQAVMNYGLNTLFSLRGAGRVDGGWLRDAANAEIATQDAAKFAALSQAAATAKYRERDPEGFKQFIQDVSGDAGVENVFIGAKDLMGALKQSGVGADEFRELMPDAAKRMAEGLATNGDVAIPVADYAAHIAGGIADPGILPHLKTSPDGMSYAEAQAFHQTQIESLRDEAAKIVAEKVDDAAFQQSRQAVRDDVLRQLNDAGHTSQDVNKVYAAMHRDFFTVLGDKLGVAPEEAYQQHGARIVAEGVGAPDREFRQNTPDELLTAFDNADEINIEAPKRSEKEIDEDEARFLSDAPAGTHYTRTTRLLRRIRKASDRAADELGGKAEAARSHAGALGPFSEYQIEGDELPPDSFHPEGMLAIRIFGKEQVEAGLTQEPALTFTVTKDGELTVNGPPPSGETFAEFQKRGWADHGRDANGEAQHGWSALKDPNNPDKPLPISQIIPLLADVHARVRAWRMEDHAGLHWNRATGAMGGLDGMTDEKGTAVYFQNDGSNRGFYSPDSRLIGLLKNADLSTFVHESGHFFLDTYAKIAASPDAPAGIKADMDAALKWFGVKDLEAWHAMSLDEQRPFHEQFARGFESYLMEGKAPSLELQPLFSRIKSWMINVYKSLSNLNVQLSPEVRGVFDRMLASENVIKQAEAARSMAPVLREKPEGVSDADWEAYQAQGKHATQDAIDEMQAKSVRDMRLLSGAKSRILREKQREAASWRKEIKDEVTKEVSKEPIEQAKRWLSTGEMIGAKGEEIKAEKGFKLNSDDVNTLFPETSLNRPDLSALKGKMSKDGLPPDLVADMFGFNSGEALIHELLADEGTKSKIEGLTDRYMLERHGELSSPEAIDRAANDAIANDARARFMATGLQILSKSPVPAAMIDKGAKEAAENAIAQKTVGELRPNQYMAAEAKNNREAIKLAPKDPAGAVAAQRAALLNNKLFRASTNAVADVRKGVDYFKRLMRKSSLDKMDVDAREQVLGLMDRFDLRQNPSDAPTRAGVNLQTWIESQIAAGYAPNVPPDILQSAAKTHYKEMTVEQFRGLVDTVKAIEHIGRERKMVMVDGKRTDLNELVRGELVPKMREKPDKFTPDQILDKAEDRHANTFAIALDHFGSWMRGIGASLKPQEFKRNQFDNHELLGPFGRAIFERVMAANYRKVDMLKGLSDDFAAKAEVLGKDWQESLLRGVDNKALADPDQPGEFLQTTRAKMLGIALHTGNESNFDKLTKGWNWQPEVVWKFLHDNMTKKDWDAVQTVWDLYEKHWPEVAEMNRRLGNTNPAKIEARPITTPFGEYRGGYAAIKYDSLRSRRGEKAAAGEAISPEGGLFGRDYFRGDTTTNGSLNARNNSYTDRVDLDYHYVARTMHETIHDLAYREALIDTSKIIEHPDFRRQFKLSYGPEGYKAMREWLGTLANSSVVDRNLDDFQKTLAYARTGIVINGIGFRISTVLKHGGSAGIKTASYFAGGGEMYLAKRFASIGTNYKAEIQGAIDKFPEIRARLLQQDRDYREMSASLFEPESNMAKAHRFGHAMVAWSDMMTAVPTAWAAYDRAIAEGIPESQGGTGKPMTEAQAVAYASKIVREAHGSNIESARSNIMNTRNEAVKMFTTLYGFMNNTYGQVANAVDRFKTPGVSRPETLARLLGAVLVPAMWAGVLVEGNPADDKEGVGHWMAKAIGAEAAGCVPLVRDAFNFVQGYRGAGLVGVESWLSTMTKPFIDAYRAWEGHDNKTAIRDTADAIGVGLHIPGLGQAGATAQYLYNVEQGKEHPRSTGEWASGLVKGHS